ncbi:MAG TPA: cation transporter [Firmicutes bacterium]|nr:cation transporter [Bacillota bacterium]
MSHNHNHGIGNYNRSFAFGVLLNVIFVIIEAVYGILSGSLSLLADAGHNLSDVISLLLAWGASVIATKAATDRRTYGFRKVTIFAPIISAVILIITLTGITWEAINRFFHPQPIKGITIIIVAAVGVVVNTLTALMFIKGQKHDLNIRGAFLHMAADAGVSLGVVIAGLIIMIKGWLWIDPVLSLIIVSVILFGIKGLLRDSIHYAIDGVPNGIDISEVKKYLMGRDHVLSIHDLHIWPLSTTETALTVHLIMDTEQLDNNFLSNLQIQLHDRFGIEHSTIQVEANSEENNCLLKKDSN